MPRLPSGTVTFMFGDIEGSTALWERDPDAMRASLQAHDDVVRDVVGAAGGIIFKHTGDGFAAVFESPSDALAAACGIERGLRAVGPIPLRSRIGVHTGDGAPRDNDYFGPDVNRAARLMDSANGGQIVVSGQVVATVEGEAPIGAGFRDVGLHRLKDLGEPMHIHRMVLSDGADLRPLRTLDATPNNLPEQVSSLIGRSGHAEEVGALVRSSRLTTLTGIGGVGKTRLSLQVAADTLNEFPDGVWFLELADLHEPGLLAHTALTALGRKLDSTQDAMEHLLEQLGSHSMLLVIDNCEHLVDDAAKFVEHVLRAAPGVRVLATSREGLAIDGERIWPVPSLTESGDDAAIELFEARARLVRADFSIDETNRTAVAELCGRLDGIPLAIELATARLTMMDVHQIVDHLGDRFRLLTGGSRTSVQRQRTLLAMMDWSYQLLSEREQALLRRMSVFRGGFDLEAAVDLAIDESIVEFEVLDLLGRLVETSTVNFEERPVPRYRLLETVRQYAEDRLSESGEADAARRRHAEHYAVVASRVAHLLITDVSEALAVGRRELANIRAAMTFAFEQSELDLGLGIAVDIREYFYNTSGIAESLRWLQIGIDQLSTIESPIAIRALATTLTDATNMGEFALVDRLAERARQSVASVTDTERRADLINALGNSILWKQPREADARYKEAIGLYRSVDNSVWVYKLLNRFLVLNATYDSDIAREVLALANEAGSRSDALQPAVVEAYIEIYEGRPARAAEILTRIDPANLNSRAAGMPYYWALVHAHRGAGNLVEARRASETVEHWTVLSNPLIFGLWQDVLLPIEEGDPSEALRIAHEAWTTSQDQTGAVWHGYFAAMWTLVAEAMGAPTTAAVAHGQWLSRATELGFRLTPHDELLLDAAVSRLRSALGDEELSRLQATGAALEGARLPPIDS